MKLVWKLLRQHISIPQFVGFFFANLIGMVIIMLGVQFYHDTQAVYNSQDSFMKADYLIVNKAVKDVFSGQNTGFSDEDMEEVRTQPFVEKFGCFTASAFRVRAGFEMAGVDFSTDMFFESVPDEFVDIKSDEWQFDSLENVIPIILPKNYLDLYNFGFAQTKDLPKISEDLLGGIKLTVRIRGNGLDENYDGQIVGFSQRLNTILVPQSFLDWANPRYAEEGMASEPNRLIMQVNNPTDDNITSFLNAHGYETDADKLDASKATYMLRIVVAIVMSVGVVITALAFYILMLSVYLLVEKNSQKLENLLIIGYSPNQVSRPYQLLTIGLNVVVLFLAVITLIIVRTVYMEMFESFFPGLEYPSILPTIIVGLVLLVVVSVLNVIAVRAKVQRIWQRKE